MRRGEELLERVGLADAADRKVGGYSGGMKRRLDLALALVHSPAHPVPRRADHRARPAEPLGPVGGGRRLAREDGVTVFLTTQYLEEADALADRVGIIDQGRIVAEGTPEALKAEVGRPSLEVVPSDAAGCDRLATVLARFGELLDSPHGAVAVRLERGADELAPVVRALDAEGVGIEHFQLHSPSLDDVFLAKTGHKLTVEEETAEPRGGARLTLLAQVGEMARRSITQTLRQPALLIPPILFPLCLLAVNVGGLDAATKLPGFPTDNYLNFAIAIPFMQGALFASINAGSSLARDVETGFLKRLALTPMRRAALLLGNLAGVMTVAALASLVYLVGRAGGRAASRGRRRRRARAHRARLPGRARVRLAGRVGRPARRLGRGGPGPLPRVLRVPLPVLAGAAAAADRAGLVPHDRDLEPGLLHARGHPLGGHHGLGPGRAGARLRDRDRALRDRHPRRLARAADAAGADMRRFVYVARGVAWRQIHNFTHNPAFLLPSIIFPLFFFTAFAGGLSNVSNAPGFDFPSGYTAFQFVFVLLQSAAFGGVFTGFAVAADFERGFARRLMLAAPEPARASSPATCSRASSAR